jgi:hypothetical protein
MATEIKKFMPEVVEVGDVYLVPTGTGIKSIDAAVVDNVGRLYFSWSKISEGLTVSGTQRFDYPLKGVLLKRKGNDLELYLEEEAYNDALNLWSNNPYKIVSLAPLFKEIHESKAFFHITPFGRKLLEEVEKAGL